MKDCDLALPPGFRFHPTDEELVMHYLCRKCASLSISVSIIAEIDLYKYDPWLLPGMASYGEKEWYFFSPRDRKYPNGSRPNRAAGSGYWKATGADKPIGNPKPVGIKKALVFYIGKAPRGLKTNWIMHEYRLADVDRSVRKKNLRLDDWVLCRIYNKKGVVSDKGIDGKPEIRTHNINGRPATMAPPRVTTLSGNGITNNHDFVHYETSDSMPKLHTESSGSEHVVSDSPEMKCEREVQSEARWMDWEKALDLQINKVNAIASSHNYSQLESNQPNQLSPLQDMFMYLHKPF